MRRLLSLCIICLFVFSSKLSAQLQKFDFGGIDKKDLEMVTYPLDSGADAVYLVRYGDVSFNESNFSLFIKMHIRVKILNESGFDKADVELRYVRGTGNIQKLKAATYNLENGKIATTTVSKKDWVDEKFNDDVWTKKLSFPDVKVGSIIEYTYSRNVGTFTSLPSWSFQLSTPVRYSEYRVQMPSYGDYMSNFQTLIRPDYNSRAGGFTHIMMKNLPALKREPYVATMDNFRSRIEFEIKSVNIPGRGSQVFMQNWFAINAELIASNGLGKAMDGTSGFKRIYPSEKGWANDEKSLIEIYEYVRDHFKWNNRNSRYIVDTHREMWEKGEGDAADINITLGAFLRNAGIEVNPVVLSTRRNGYVKRSAPLLGQFNYVLMCATIGEKQYLLDATDKFRAYNVLPERVINDKGLMVTEKGPTWLDLNLNKESDAKTISGEFSINEDEILEGNMTLNFRGTAASRLRDSMLEELEKSDGIDDEEKDEEDEEDAETLDDYKTGEVTDLEVENLEDPNQNLKINYNFTTEEGMNFIGDKIFMSPILIKHITENPFKLDERLFPIELPAPVADTYLFKIHIPEGYEVEELPKSQNILLPDKGGRYMYTIGVQDDFIQVMVRLNLMKTFYAPEEYATLKELFNLIISKQEEQIVLKESGQ